VNSVSTASILLKLSKAYDVSIRDGDKALVLESYTDLSVSAVLACVAYALISA